MTTDAAAAATAKPPTWYRVGAWVLFAWMLMGILSFLNEMRMDEAAIAQLPEAMQGLYAIMPSWMRVIFAVATISGFVGALGLVLRKTWSIPLLVTSLAAIIVQMSYWLFVMNAMEALGAGAAGMPVTLVVVGAFAIWFAMKAKALGVLTS